MLNIPHVTGEPYAPALSFYNEQVANPSISSPALLVGRAVVRILRGELVAAQSDLEEAEAILTRAQCERGTDDMLAAMVVAASLGGGKKGDADELWRYVSLLPRLLAFSLWIIRQPLLKPAPLPSNGCGYQFQRTSIR